VIEERNPTMTTRTLTRPRTLAATIVAAIALSGTALAACDTTPAARAAVPSVADHGGGHHHHRAPKVSAKTQRLYTTMLGLWDQHMEWTWSAVVAFATDAPDLRPTLERLLQNQADIGDAIASFYGPEAGDRITELLRAHINDALPVLQAAKAGDTAALRQALDVWYANANEIADFLSDANPRNWARDDMREMMKIHIDQTTAYAAAALAGDYQTAIVTYDEAQAHMAEMADVLSAGIVAQFPRRF
jgi:hypothetical protein